MGILYLDGQRLRRSLLAATDWVEAGRDELNRINVFPVPDGDTGTNFASTLRAVADAVRGLDHPTLPSVAQAMSDSSLAGAHGNSGMLLSQFLMGFGEPLRDLSTATPSDVAGGIRLGADRLYGALDEPVEGTILTVCREVAEAAESVAATSSDFVAFMRHLQDRAREALARTPDLLAALRDAGVVDAGAKGFVRVIEGVVRLIEGQPIEPAAPPTTDAHPSAAASTHVVMDRDFQFCTEVMLRGSALPTATQVRSQLRVLGGSIVLIAASDRMKIHIHTNAPQQVFDLAGSWGTVESTRADDMRKQHRELHVDRRPVAIVVDSTADLPDSWIDERGIVVVPIQVMDGERTYTDRVDIDGPEIYGRMQRDRAVFSTSQPAPGAFATAFRDAGNAGDRVLCITVAGALSGTIGAARAAAKTLGGKPPVEVLDSRTVSLGLGLLAVRAYELVTEGLTLPEITAELERIRDQSGSLITFDTLENLVRSGRVSRLRGWLGSLLSVKPILEVDRQGNVAPVDRARGREAVMARVMEILDTRLTPRPQRLRVGIAHANAAAVARELEHQITERFAPLDCVVGDVTAAIGIHAGPGAWGVFYQVEDGTPPAARNNPDLAAL